MKKIAISLLLGIAVLSLGFDVNAASAFTPCDNTNHCYSISTMAGQNTYPDAAGADLSVTCLSVANRSTDHISWEMWFWTNTPQVSYATSVEVGLASGTVAGVSGFSWFWADTRPIDGFRFAAHYIGGANTGTHTNVSVYHGSNSDQNVYVGGNYVGTSTNNGSGGLYADAGMETTTLNATVQGLVSNFQTRSGGVWHPQTQNWYANDYGWTTVSESGSTFYATSGCGGARAASAHSTNTGKAGLIAQPSPLSAAQSVISMANGKAVGQVLSVATTRQAAAKLLFGGDTVVGDGAVDAVQMSGTFYAPSAPSNNAKKGVAPSGDLLTVLVDKSTGNVTDWVVSKSSSGMNINSLGAVTPLY